ncbi:Sterol desaturase/sphingolipid hydroxylase, fatty acid hydroxylase superfamily [Marinobacter segnicrescens]|uniref:Sterol desaturase/sphingolipid hydroxylase, fatty acid hydroxylase superfamily n=1 Tax=Marinobacter segnicrescens TaxID=430453 RepID=A0A1I0EEH2_9GAMM|nr:sterol desaturase family protein [Marinobacter segnicrescens]SET43182.1 Sterol desaturase/sphingolipid hydroxylase, fatty acid hydroxylase superfamily [Marinobacter segnicrescens]
MTETLLAHEPVIQFGFFLSVLVTMALWEVFAARRPQAVGRRTRWPANLMIVVLDTLAVRVLFPVAAVGAALMASENGWGLLNLVALPAWVSVVLAVLMLDAAIYFQHRVFHAVPWLWRLHRMHHADLEFDVTTALRFHPVEIVLSMMIKVAIVVLLGAPVLAVLIFEVLLNATAMFNHGNVRLPLWLDKWLRLIVVTPDMHRVHHSIIRRETDSNFGFNLPWWDRLFGTYRDQPEKGHLGMTIGIEDFRTRRDLRLDQMLIQPLRNSVLSSGSKVTSNGTVNTGKVV